MNFVQVPPAALQDSAVMYLAMHWKAGLSCPLGGGQVIPSKLFGITHMSVKERLKKKLMTETTCNREFKKTTTRTVTGKPGSHLWDKHSTGEITRLPLVR